MENIGKILLTENQKSFISGMINMYGDGQHPISDKHTFDHFTIEYVKELSEKPEVLANLSSAGVDILNEIKTRLVNPCGHYDVKVNSLWDYDRSLCQSPTWIGLKVKEVKNGKVSFYEKMAYIAYGIEYFNDKTFKPHVKK